MGETSIEWCDYTFNPWWGCDPVSPACDHCYAQAWAHRLGMDALWKGERRFFGEEHWLKPHTWNRKAAAAGQRARVFCASMADVFDNHEGLDDVRAMLWELIRETPHLDWLLLTKRIGNAERMLPWGPYDDPWHNVWLGATVINQDELDRDLRKLLTVSAAVRFLSCEPLLGPLEFGRHGLAMGLHWVICGGESGRQARPLDVDWAVRLRGQCASRGIAFFMKQGSAANWIDFKRFDSFLPEIRVREWPNGERGFAAASSGNVE